MRLTHAQLEKALERSLLVEVMDQAMTSTADTRAMAQRMQQLAGVPLSLPWVTQLVHGMLCSYLRVQAEPSGRWHAMCEQVAQSMIDDPLAFGRLSKLWKWAGENK